MRFRALCRAGLTMKSKSRSIRTVLGTSAGGRSRLFPQYRGMARLACFNLAVLFLLSGCNSHSLHLGAVREYVKATVDAGTGFAAVSDDLYGSCLRFQEYDRLTSVDGRPLWSDLPTRKPEPTPVPVGVVPKETSPSRGDSECQTSSDLAYRWNMENQAILGYVRALGTVAGVYVMPTNFDRLADSLKGAGLIANDGIATAAGKLSQRIADSLVAARQRADVYEVAQSAQKGGLNEVVRGIRDVVLAEYRQELKNERQAVDEYYATTLQGETKELAALQCPITVDAQARRDLSCRYYPAPHKRMTAFRQAILAGRVAQLRDLIRTQRAARERDFNLIAQRETAADAYDAALRDVVQGNEAILKSRPGDIEAIAQAVKPYAADLRSSVFALLAALKSQGESHE